jgi:hypothetical protein
LSGFDSFAEIGDGNTTYYSCTDGTDFEVGIGTYTASGTTLSRDSVLESSGVTASADVNGTVTASTSVAVDGNSGTIAVGMRVRGTGISGVVTVATVTTQSAIVLDTAVTLADDTALTFGDGKINWSAGTRTVFCTMPAEKMIYNDASGNAVNFTEQDPQALAFAIALG